MADLADDLTLSLLLGLAAWAWMGLRAALLARRVDGAKAQEIGARHDGNADDAVPLQDNQPAGEK